MLLIGIVGIIGLWAFVLGSIKQLVGKNNPKAKYTLYIVATIIFVISVTIMLAKNT